MKKTAPDPYPLIGNAFPKTKALRTAKSDLSDWVDLMELVEALCPKWPERPPEKYGVFKL
jgi:hypothetical protein